MKMKPMTIEDNGKEVTLHCRHEDEWPPVHAALDDSFEEQRNQGLIDDVKLQQLQVWQRVCGLKAMSPQKCPDCPLSLAEDKYGNLEPYAAKRGPKPAHPPFASAKQNKLRR